MPFEDAGGAPLERIELAQVPAAGDRFELGASFAYRDPVSGRGYEVPASAASAPWTSDLASVPHLFWSFIASFGRQSAPALLHDHRSILAAELARSDRAAALRQRRDDDRVFRTALREQGVPVLRAWLMWGWVAADRERQFGGPAGILFLGQAIVGALVLLAALVLAWWMPWAALAGAAVFLLALPWGRLAGLLVLLTASGALLAPLVAVHLVPLAVFRLIEAIVELVSGGDPRGVARPTVRTPRREP